MTRAITDNKMNKPENFCSWKLCRQRLDRRTRIGDHCTRLKEVLKCFEEVLINCDSGYHFFRYRHLLYALSGAHDFLCSTPDSRKERFLVFLKTIKCAEEARRKEVSCHRHNVSSVVWNKILRVEVGEEICDSLSTQRACLLEHKYIHSHCKDVKRVQIYEDLSSYFLSLWCQYPVHPKLISMTQKHSTGMNSKSDKNISYYWISFVIPLLLIIFSTY
ncbi:hypothetical protein Avbf_15818 [Armadillidium vulgare]|nr:hypothetical protein Avbf_15818 [Armadillidium vulgare]